MIQESLGTVANKDNTRKNLENVEKKELKDEKKNLYLSSRAKEEEGAVMFVPIFKA